MITRRTILLPMLAGSMLLLTAMAPYLLGWQIGEGHAIRFSTEKVEGTFSELKGTIVFEQDDLAHAMFDVEVAAASIETGIGLKNKHARSESWFDVERYPAIRFKSNNVSRTSAGYETRGRLELHGVQREVSIPFTFESQTFKGGFELNRLDYKLGPETGLQGSVGKLLKIELSVPVLR